MRRRWLALAGAAALLGSGCGIRPTPTAVDAGAPPPRASCTTDSPSAAAAPTTGTSAAATSAPPEGRAPSAVASPSAGARASAGTAARGGDEPRTVFLVCAGRLTPVTRHVSYGAGRRSLADGLLRALAERPSAAQSDRGYGTSVPEDLGLRPRGKGDPPWLLRISPGPQSLSEAALDQVVCTLLANPPVGGWTPARATMPPFDSPTAGGVTAPQTASPQDTGLAGQVRLAGTDPGENGVSYGCTASMLGSVISDGSEG